jgi:hypothetical protein
MASRAFVQQSRPRADLSKVDTGLVPHGLYVKVVTEGDPDTKSRDLTLSVLKYVHARLGIFAQMGIAVKVQKIRSQDLRNPQIVEVMKRRGILRLPALTTPNGVYLGFTDIQDVYDRNIREYESSRRRGEQAVEGAILQDDDLDGFFRSEMTFARAEEDAQETGLGEEGNMMDSYRHMMERREKSGASSARKATQFRPAEAPPPQSRAAPPRAAPPPGRPDNVARQRPADPYDDEIQDTINRLSQDIDDGTRMAAFAGGGGDSFADEDGGGNDAQDDLMERAYYTNLSSSENF